VPQAGLILGRKVLVERMAKHPLLRAVRSDKLTLAALEATLQLYLDAERLPERLPVLPMLTRPENEMKERSERLMALLRELAGIAVDCRPGTTYAGGGSLAGAELSTWLVRLAPKRLAVDALAARLRVHRPAIIGRIKENRLLLDMRTVADGELPEIADALRQVLV
jgi:L-seryl-tRNA(Ser) seleniumtransferase